MLVLALFTTVVPIATFTVTDDSYTTNADTAHLKVLTNTKTGEFVSYAWPVLYFRAIETQEPRSLASSSVKTCRVMMMGAS